MGVHGQFVRAKKEDSKDLKRELYRVKNEVIDLKPFPHLAFPHFPRPEDTSKQLGFDGELMASSLSSVFNKASCSEVQTNDFRIHRGGFARLAPLGIRERELLILRQRLRPQCSRSGELLSATARPA